MKIVMVSNYLTHHQIPFCVAMGKEENVDFLFIETEQMPQERIDLGWKQQKQTILGIEVLSNATDNTPENHAVVKEKIDNADVVIIGGTSIAYIEHRLKENKLTFLYEERMFKKSNWQILNPHTLYMIYKCHVLNQRKQVYMLCAGAYLPKELKQLHLYKNKMFQWGYFPETKIYDLQKLVAMKKHEVIEIVWCARFIDWKHPEYVIELADEIKEKKLNVHISMIGNGVLFDEIQNQIKAKSLSQYITLVGSIKSSKTREYMENASIFIATSDRQEGWGAVINEAMNSGCAVVANKQMGAVPFLINNGENGMYYTSKKKFIDDTISLIQRNDICEEMGTKAYNQIVTMWNAEIAAKRFINLCNSIAHNEKIDLYMKGPIKRL